MSAAAAPGPPRLGQRVALASLYAILQRVILRGIGVVSTVILARLLTPEDFGIVGVAAVAQTMLEGLTSTGFGLALIRMQAPGREHYDTAFTLTVIRSLLLAGALVGTADLQAGFMREPRVAPLMWLMGLTAVMQSLESIRMFDLQRDLRFDTLLRYHVFQKILGFAITIPLAFWLRSYWALVLAAPLSRIVTIPLSYRIAPHRPRLALGAWREFFHFSKWLFLGNISAVLSSQLMNLVIGRVEGMVAVGLYQIAYQIAALPISEIAAPLAQPAYAGFAKVRHNRGELHRYVLTGLALQWLLILPLSAGIALTAHEVTLLFLGQSWTALVPLMPLVAMFALFEALGGYLASLFIVLNRQARLVITGYGVMLLRIGSVIYAAVTFGLIGAAWATLGVTAFNFLLWLLMAGHLLGDRPGWALGALWRPATAAVLMAAVVLAIPADAGALLGPAPWSIAGTLAIKSAAGAAVYVALALGLWRAVGMPGQSAEGHLARMTGGALARLRAMIPTRRPSG
jgi:O-antigen/teichoic acid export membrane protein